MTPDTEALAKRLQLIEETDYSILIGMGGNPAASVHHDVNFLLSLAKWALEAKEALNRLIADECPGRICKQGMSTHRASHYLAEKAITSFPKLP